MGQRQLIPILLFTATCGADLALAQSDVLPRGVGAFFYNYRQYMNRDSYFEADGTKKAAGDLFSANLKGPDLLKGAGGSELKKLAEELKAFRLEGQDGFSSQLDLGRFEADVDAEVKAHVLGGAYGISRHLTLFAGIPFIQATVRTNLTHAGGNNAAEIRDQLGGLAFTELRDGLNRAAALDTDTIHQDISDKGYEPVDEWRADGFGDFRVGLAHGARRRLGRWRATLVTTSALVLPTGRPDDPDILTDAAFGQGTPGLGLGLAPKLEAGSARIAGLLYGQWNAPGEQETRVPEDGETLVDQDRKATVRKIPGADARIEGEFGWDFGLFDLKQALGRRSHEKDRFEGKLEGDYAALAEGSARSEVYGETRLRIDTVRLWRRRKVLAPFHLTLTYHKPFRQRGGYGEESVEFGVMSFFRGPRH